MPPRLIPYDRVAAVRYARFWAYRRNPEFFDYENIGGDCTNFASQCLYAGTGVMNYTPTFGWYYINANQKAPAWTGVTYLYNFLLRQGNGPGPIAVSTELSGLMPGDLVQLQLTKEDFSHTPVVTSIEQPLNLDTVLVAAHSNDADCRPLSSYQFKNIRFLHILGANPT